MILLILLIQLNYYYHGQGTPAIMLIQLARRPSVTVDKGHDTPPAGVAHTTTGHVYTVYRMSQNSNNNQQYPLIMIFTLNNYQYRKKNI